jgi:hypothetical protein
VVRKVDHLGSGTPPRHLIGRTGKVWGHEPDGANIVTGVTMLRGQVFYDDDLSPA